MRIAFPAFIVPFMFVYEPSLLMIGDWTSTLMRAVPSTLGVICFAAGLQGYLLRETRPWERIALLVAAVLLVKPGIVTDVMGLVLLATVLLVQRSQRGLSPAPAERAAKSSD